MNLQLGKETSFDNQFMLGGFVYLVEIVPNTKNIMISSPGVGHTTIKLPKNYYNYPLSRKKVHGVVLIMNFHRLYQI